MDKLDKLKDEYMLYEVEAVPNNKEEVMKTIKLFIKDMNKSINCTFRAIRENYREEQFAKVRNIFLNALGYEEESIECFSYDTNVLLQHRSLAETYKGYFSRMGSVVNDYNFEDIYKLTMYTYDSYEGNYEYLESLRDSISFMTSGISYCGVGEDTQEVFSKFFTDIFDSVVSKGKEKVKTSS